MADVFISYAKQDRAVAERLAQVLGAHGWSVWWDRNLEAGSQWDEVIERELDGAKCVVVLWSPAAIKSQWVRSEAERARTRKVLVSCIIRPTQLPVVFAPIQAVDLSSWDLSIGSPCTRPLVAAVERYVGVRRDSVGLIGELAGRYELVEETWDPSDAPDQMVSGAEPGETLELTPAGVDVGRYEALYAGTRASGRVEASGNELHFTQDGSDYVTIQSVQKHGDGELSLLRVYKLVDGRPCRIVQRWKRVGSARTDIARRTRYQLNVRALAALRTLCPVDTVSLSIGLKWVWTGKFRTGDELPVGRTHVFSTSEEITLRLVPCDTTMEAMERASVYRFHEAKGVVTKRDAGLGERTMTIQSDAGFDYEVAYEVTASRDVPEERAARRGDAPVSGRRSG